MTTTHYTHVARVLHWLMAVLIVCALALGLVMTDMETSPAALRLYGLHKSTGIVVLALVAVRLLWRLFHPAPPPPEGLPRWQVHAATLGHAGLYALMFALPLSGWMLSSAAGFPVSVYGLFTLPNLVAPDKELREFLGETHELFAYGLMALLVAHVAAALWHHVIRKDDVLRRMWWVLPWLVVLHCGSAVAVEKTSPTPKPVAASEPSSLPQYESDLERSHVRFVALQNRAPVEGAFKNYHVTVMFDPDMPHKSRIAAEVDVSSVFMDYEQASAEITKPEWLGVAAHPKATFVTTEIHRMPSKSSEASAFYYADGEMTIRGITKPAQVNFQLIKYTPDEAIAEGRLTLLRRDFGVGQGDWAKTDVVDDAVAVNFRVVASRVKQSG